MTDSNLTPREKRLIEQAEAAFEAAKKSDAPPASQYFLDKCESGTPSAEVDDAITPDTAIVGSRRIVNQLLRGLLTK